jgi:hypothetical protein
VLFDVSKHKYQQMVLDSQSRLILCLAGAQGGKTTIGMVWLLLQLQKNLKSGVPGQFLIATPDYKTWISSTKVKFYEMFPTDWGAGQNLGWHEKDGYFETAWGAKIYVRSVDNPNSIEGMTLDAAWLDEFGNMEELVWINIQRRVLAKKGRIIFTTTPYPKNLGLLRQVYSLASTINDKPVDKPAEQLYKDLAIYEWTTSQNPGIDPVFLEEQKKLMSKEMFDLSYNAKLASPQGLVYPDFDLENDVVAPFPIPAHWRRFGGIDFGFGSITAVVVIAEQPPELDAQGKPKSLPTFFIIREFYEKGAGLNKVAAFLHMQDMSSILGDPRGAQEMHELSRAYGVRFLSKADNSVESGIERLKVITQEHRVKAFKNCVNFIDEISTYHYKPETGDKDSDGLPAKVHDHEMDAFRYAFSHEFHKVYKPTMSSIKYKMQTSLKPIARRSTMPLPNKYTGY